LSKLYSRVENSKTDKVWVTSRCGSIPATRRSGVLRSARTCCGFSGMPMRRRAVGWHSRGSGESFTGCDFVVWEGLVGGGRRVVVGYSNGSAEVFDMKPGVLNDKTP
jgi:hypothetical protein